jgi:uncharacterized protein (DUF1015 family)
MLDFRPFQAWRYHSSKVELSHVIAPPYDVISADEREALYERSPFNVVRLILGKEDNFYENARTLWAEWSRQGILVQDPRPVFYLYEQTFNHPWASRPLRRLALVGILKLERSGSVLPHEQTLSAPKKDRFLLLEKTKTNLSPVFGLYQDSSQLLAKLFSSARSKPPLFRARDDQKILHQGWAIVEERDQKAVREALKQEKVLIADGHHRYETALEYASEMREKLAGQASEAPFDFVMMALVEFADEGLLVLPTHRIIHSFGPCPKKDFLDRLRIHFDFLPFPERELFSEMNRRSPKEKVLGAFLGSEGSFLLRLKNLETVRELMPPGKPSLWYEVEANLAAHFIFSTLWGISGKEQEGLIRYTRSWEEAAREVGEGRAEAAFLLRSVGVDTIRKLADTGERMPQKTTYFYPKLASGIFFYHHETG